MNRKVPVQKPGRSEQSVQTPTDFLDAVRKRLRIDQFFWDLAADADNTVVPNDPEFQPEFSRRHFNETDDALVQDWPTKGWNWLNPPYADLEPWVTKAWHESQKGSQTVVLVPASTGSNWWRDWVSNLAYINHLNGRLTFVGHKTPYPKDLALIMYTPWGFTGTTTWNWRNGQ